MTQYKDYGSGNGRFKHDVAGGQAIENQIFQNRVDGAFITAPTTASHQATGAGNGHFLYNITQGIVVLDGKVLEIAAAADQACEAEGNIMADGYSKIYLLITYKAYDGTLTRLTVKGTAALTAAVVPPTVAAIEALIPADASWLCIGATQINRTGDTTVTQTVTNQYRPMFLPKTAHET